MKQKEMMYELADYLKKNHCGKENGIPRAALAKKLGIDGQTLKALRSKINFSTEIEMVVSTSGSVYMCNTDEEIADAYIHTIKPAITMFKKSQVIKKKGGLNGQVKIKLDDSDEDVVQLFSKDGEAK